MEKKTQQVGHRYREIMYNLKQSDQLGFMEKLIFQQKHEGGEVVTQTYTRGRNILNTANTMRKCYEVR